MKYYHFCNDFSLDLDLTSKTLGTSMDPTMLRSVKFFTRKNGRLYTCSYGNNTLINNGDTVTCVLNNHGLEAGVLQYVCEFLIPDSTYPDFYKKIHQFYVSDIELVTGNGELLEVDVEAMYGTTIDGKFNELEAGLDEVSEEVDVISASIVSIQELNTVQDTSINRIEEMLENFDPSGSDAVQRLDTSVDLITRDVASLNSSVNSLYTQTEENATGLVSVTNTVNDVSTRVNDVETVLGRKADASVLTNYYTKDETYNKDEVDRAIADAAMDGSLPAGIVIDNNYVHTDNNYTNADKAKVRDFDLSLYPTNSSLSANYATKAELQNVDDNHPSNSSVSNNYVKKNDMSNYLSDYPTNSSVSENYATKAQIRGCIDENDLAEALADYPTNSSVSDNYVHWLYANENYVSYENIDEIFYNLLENSQRTENKVNEIVSDSSTISDISTNVSDVSVKVIDVSVKAQDISTRLNRDYLNASLIARDYITNASVAANYTTKDEFNEVWTTGFLTQDSADELYAKTTDISTFISENDVSTFITEDDFALHSWGAIGLKNTEVVNKHSLGADVSNYMFAPLNFRTLSDYLSDTYTSKLDMSDYLTENDVSNFVTTNDISTFITQDYVDNQISEVYNVLDDSYAEVGLISSLRQDLVNDYVSNSSLDNKVSNLGYIKSNDVSNYLQKNTDIEVNSVLFTDNNAVTSYLNIDKANSNNSYILSIGLPDTDAGGELTDREVVAARSIYNGDSEQTELAFGQTSTWTILGNPSKNTKIQGRDVSIGKTSGNVEILGQNVSIGGRNVNDFITSNDVSVYATTSYVDAQIGNIQNILSTI